VVNRVSNPSIRYSPSFIFPPYAFLPGRDRHPNAEGGYRFQILDPKPACIDVAAPFSSDALRIALDLFNHEFYWESHVYNEALWNAHGRTGSVAAFLKVLIKLAAAGVKLKLGEMNPAQLHITQAHEQLLHLQEKEGRLFLGFSLQALIAGTQKTKCESIILSGEFFEIHPVWK
jgi:hypothetical protein